MTLQKYVLGEIIRYERLTELDQTREEIATWPKLKTPEDGRQYVQDRLKEGVDCKPGGHLLSITSTS